MNKTTSPLPSNLNGEFLLGLVLLVFSVFVMIESVGMPLKGPSGFMMSPGFVPFLLGMILFCLSAGYTLSVWLKGGNQHLWKWFQHNFAENENKRFFFILFLTGIYIIGLLGRVHFGLATFLFLLSLFYYLKVGKIFKTVLYAILATALVAFVLPALFDMPLP